MRRTVILFVVALAGRNVPAAGQILVGSVTEDSTGKALPGVEVVVEGSSRSTTTDATGRYLLDRVPAGNRTILFRLIGYRPYRTQVQLLAGETIQANARLTPERTQQLDPVEVKGSRPAPRGLSREGFEERRKMGFGRFVDSAELRRSENRRPSDVLRGMQGVQIVRFKDCQGNRCGPVEERAGSARGTTSIMSRTNTEYCWMTVLLDGNPIYTNGSSRPPPDFSRDFRVSDFDAIEVYRSSAEVPPEFGGSVAQCGVILLWSRRG